MSEGIEESSWRKAGNAEVNETTGDVRPLPGSEWPSPDDGMSGDREPRNPRIPPFAGAAALEAEQQV